MSLTLLKGVLAGIVYNGLRPLDMAHDKEERTKIRWCSEKRMKISHGDHQGFCEDSQLYSIWLQGAKPRALPGLICPIKGWNTGLGWVDDAFFEFVLFIYWSVFLNLVVDCLISSLKGFNWFQCSDALILSHFWITCWNRQSMPYRKQQITELQRINLLEV